MPAPTDKIYSVSQLNELSGAVLARVVGPVWVRGEISGLKTQPSGHIYFALKDAGSLLNVALFRPAAMRLGLQLAEGKQVLIFGELDIYLPRGSYQLIAQFALEEGFGKLQQEFERLKKQLEAEGLFAPQRKRPIPRLPTTLAFVSSPTGAVWQDFTQILTRRDWRGKVILFPCRVQGAEAPAEILGALRRAQAHPGVQLIVVGRGGGSLEDLWAFNNEQLVRAIAESTLPVISAVGHQTDFTLCDFAADLRAETPSAAAELIAGHFNNARTQVEELARRIKHALAHHTTLRLRHLAQLHQRLASRSPRLLLQRHAQRLDELSARLAAAPRQQRALKQSRLATLAARLQGLDPQLTLQRGYTLVQGPHGLITRAAGLAHGQQVSLRFADGERSTQIISSIINDKYYRE